GGHQYPVVAGRIGHGFPDRLLYVSPLLSDVLWHLAGRSARGGTSSRSASSHAYAPYFTGAPGVVWRFSRLSAGAWECASITRAGLYRSRAPARRTPSLWLWGRCVDARLARRGHCRMAPGAPGL